MANICSFSPLIETLFAFDRELKSVGGQEPKWLGLGSSLH